MSKLFARRIFLTTTLTITGLWQAASTVSAQTPAIRFDERTKATIALPQNATQPEQTAARELDDYLTKITGGDFTVQVETTAVAAPAIYVGNTAFAKKSGLDGGALPSEEWHIKTQDGNLILVGGGTRGTLYATYRFLEDNAGVRWWTPWEETVPTGALQLPALDRKGKPVFGYRDIYMLYGNDNGRFAIRNRLNRDGDAPVGAEYGGSRDYGPPYHAHTFYYILPPKTYFKDHPEWFLIPGGGEPVYSNSQLVLSNPEMRAEFLKNLREIIRKSHAEAREKGLPEPDVFSVSQEDNMVKFATPADAELLAKNDGAESAILLDFINYLADGIKDEFPGVYIDTLAYFSGEKAPTNIRPRDNVIIRLTDTTSNLLLPITHPRNKAFHDHVVSWGKLTKNLRVWDYAITFAYPGLPMPTTHTYPTDLQFLKANNVEGIFVEHEYPVRADIRDLKIWLQTKLFEDPYRDYDGLVREFTDGYYGPAGVHVRRYISELENEAKKMGEQYGMEEITWFVPGRQYNYLSLDFLTRANTIFDEAQKAAGSDEVHLRRVRHARLSLDRAIALLHSKLIKQWVSEGNAPGDFPLKRDQIAARYAQTWNEQIDLRLPEEQRAEERKAATTEIARLTAGPEYVLPPSKFRDLPLSKVIAYPPGQTRNHADMAKVFEDQEAESGRAVRLLMDDVPEAEREKYKLPMPWGIYDTVGNKHVMTQTIAPANVPGPGYHWYKLGDVPLSGTDYIFFFWSWNVQMDVNDAYDSKNPKQLYEVWANLKFEGPMFPHGKAEDKSAIFMEHVVLVKK